MNQPASFKFIHISKFSIIWFFKTSCHIVCLHLIVVDIIVSINNLTIASKSNSIVWKKNPSQKLKSTWITLWPLVVTIQICRWRKKERKKRDYSIININLPFMLQTKNECENTRGFLLYRTLSVPCVNRPKANIYRYIWRFIIEVISLERYRQKRYTNIFVVFFFFIIDYTL